MELGSPLAPGRLLRLKEVLQVIPISRSAFYAGIKAGRFPPPVKLGERTSAWRSDSLIPIVERGV
jgi:prophage regulatory protein